MEDEQLNGNSGVSVKTSCERSLAFYAYRNRDTGRDIFTLWMDGEIPENADRKETVSVTVSHANIEQAVYVDIISGQVFEIPEKFLERDGDSIKFRNIPLYDGPVLIADRSLITYTLVK